MAYITLDELKTALNVGDLYPDDMLDDVIQTAESVIEPFLTTHRAGVHSAKVASGTVTFSTIQLHDFAVGQNVIITGTDYDDTYEVTGATAYTFTADTAEPDTVAHIYKPLGKAELDTAATYDNVVAVRQAAMMIAVDVFNARTVPGGQAQGIDFQPGPYMMGRSILSRVSGLLAPYRDMGSIIG